MCGSKNAPGGAFVIGDFSAGNECLADVTASTISSNIGLERGSDAKGRARAPVPEPEVAL